MSGIVTEWKTWRKGKRHRTLEHLVCTVRNRVQARNSPVQYAIISSVVGKHIFSSGLVRTDHVEPLDLERVNPKINVYRLPIFRHDQRHHNVILADMFPRNVPLSSSSTAQNQRCTAGTGVFAIRDFNTHDEPICALYINIEQWDAITSCPRRSATLKRFVRNS